MKWDLLSQEQYYRLCNCSSRRADIVPIAKCYKVEKGVSADDALVLALEHLDMNGQFFDPTTEEYNKMLNQI